MANDLRRCPECRRRFQQGPAEGRYAGWCWPCSRRAQVAEDRRRLSDRPPTPADNVVGGWLATGSLVDDEDTA